MEVINPFHPHLLRSRMPHHTCGCLVNSPNNHTCGARAVNVWCGFFLGFFFLKRIDVSKIQVSDKKTLLQNGFPRFSGFSGETGR
jgi:hypothetical protein